MVERIEKIFFGITRLFRRLATETAALTGLAYPADADASISGYLAGFAPRIDAASSGADTDSS